MLNAFYFTPYTHRETHSQYNKPNQERNNRSMTKTQQQKLLSSILSRVKTINTQLEVIIALALCTPFSLHAFVVFAFFPFLFSSLLVSRSLSLSHIFVHLLSRILGLSLFRDIVLNRLRRVRSSVSLAKCWFIVDKSRCNVDFYDLFFLPIA